MSENFYPRLAPKKKKIYPTNQANEKGGFEDHY